MNIVGIGTHILDCPRVRKLIDTHAEKFIEEVYTPEEAAYCRDRSHSTEFYAGIWAAKEAVFRSLGMKWKRGVDWRDVVIECVSAIEPKVTVRGPTAERMAARGATRVMVSFSYSRMFATATAIAIRA
ncbi:MAG: holo-ACP synthase [Fimbriiglobus sp.]|jgi:holo-[acyl-carrier protein] synthase|nr:holo-ACP synthase [Fimbriiglobus sp.]